MKLLEIFNILDKISPFELQESWDNSGLSVGSLHDKIDLIYLSLDADMKVLEQMEKNSLLIVHHPLIFKGIKELNYDFYVANLIKYAIKKDISIISMHTNFDKTHLNRYVVNKVLGFCARESEDFICYFDVDMDFEEFIKVIKEKLNLKYIKCVKTKEFVKKAAIVVGSGSELLHDIKADCFLTGDIKYHVAKEAYESGISLIDIRHYESEIYFAKCLQNELQNFSLNAIIANSKNPFYYI